MPLYLLAYDVWQPPPALHCIAFRRWPPRSRPSPPSRNTGRISSSSSPWGTHVACFASSRMGMHACIAPPQPNPVHPLSQRGKSFIAPSIHLHPNPPTTQPQQVARRLDADFVVVPVPSRAGPEPGRSERERFFFWKNNYYEYDGLNKPPSLLSRLVLSCSCSASTWPTRATSSCASSSPSPSG